MAPATAARPAPDAAKTLLAALAVAIIGPEEVVMEPVGAAVPAGRLQEVLFTTG